MRTSASGRLACLLAAEAAQAALAQNFGRLAKAARKKGLTGYDLIDDMDPWYGSDIPPFQGPSKLLDALGNQDGRVTMEDWTSAGLPKDHFEYFDKDKDALLDRDESVWWFMQRKPARHMNLTEIHNPPKGHLQRLGSWRDPLPSADLTYHKPYPHPREFWRKHMDGYLPAVLKGAQLGWPAMNWTRQVLRDRFGWVDAKLEPKTEGRGNATAYRELERLAPRHRLNISDYLHLEPGNNIYVVSIIPQVMAWEVAHPAALLCGSRQVMVNKETEPPYKLGKHEYPHEAHHIWMTHVFEANLWMASGRTRSQLHYDKEWNVNCLLSGRKRWFFLNPFDYDEELQWARGRKFRRRNPLNNAWTDWVYLDPDHVDLIVQNKLRHMDYYELIQEPGDCIFIPYAMLHQVEKLDEDLQVAVSWMFLPETVYDERACSAAPLAEDLPLAVMDTLYMYTGRGIIPQGYVDPLNFVRQLEGAMKRKGARHLSLDIFTAEVSNGDAILRTIPGRQKRVQKIYNLLTSHAADPSKGLSPDELRKVPLRLWCKPAAEGDSEGPLPCDRGEEYFFCSDEEFKKMEAYVQGSLARLAASRAGGGPAPVPAPPQRAPPRAWAPRRRPQPRPPSQEL